MVKEKCVPRTIKKPTEDIFVDLQDILQPIDDIVDDVFARYPDKVSVRVKNQDDSGFQHVEISRRSVYELALSMDSDANISRLLNIDESSLRAHFKDMLSMARAVTKNKLKRVNLLYALQPKYAADRIFALKNYCGMSDNGLIEAIETETNAVFKVVPPPKPEWPVDEKIPEEVLDEES